MLISVLIPVYQQDVSILVIELYHQLKVCNIQFEISCLDDYSDDNFRKQNRNIINEAFPEIIYDELSSNIGRSAIRNELAQRAQGEFLWFLDCDAEPRANPQLARNFVNRMRAGVLLSGGRIYSEQVPENSQYYLHWLWCSQRELIDPVKRMQDPVNNFLSNNFVMHRNDFNKVRFNTELSGYGYEDTLFAYQLNQKGIAIEHINNPVIHAGIETKTIFLSKIKESLYNLIKLETICQKESIAFPVKSKLSSIWFILRKPFLFEISKSFSRLMLPFIEQKVLGKRPNLFVLDLYRIMFLLKISKR